MMSWPDSVPTTLYKGWPCPVRIQQQWSLEGHLDGQHRTAFIIRPTEQALNLPGLQALKQLPEQLRTLCQQPFLVLTACLLK